MQNIFGIHKKKFFEEIISLLEKKNGRPFKEITVRNCKKCGTEVSIKETKEHKFGLLCRSCYAEYMREYAKKRTKIKQKGKSYNDMTQYMKEVGAIE